MAEFPHGLATPISDEQEAALKRMAFILENTHYGMLTLGRCNGKTIFTKLVNDSREETKMDKDAEGYIMGNLPIFGKCTCGSERMIIKDNGYHFSAQCMNCQRSVSTNVEDGMLDLAHAWNKGTILGTQKKMHDAVNNAHIDINEMKWAINKIAELSKKPYTWESPTIDEAHKLIDSLDCIFNTILNHGTDRCE